MVQLWDTKVDDESYLYWGLPIGRMHRELTRDLHLKGGGTVAEVRLREETKMVGCKECQVAMMNAPQ